MEAVRLTRSVHGTVLPEAEEALHRAVTASRIVLNEPDLGGALDWSPDGVFVTEGPENSGRIDLRDAATGASVRTWESHYNDINDVQFSQDGSMLATGGDDGALRVWDPGSGELIAAVQEAGPVLGVSFDSGGSLVAASWLEPPMIRIARPATGEVVRTIAPPGVAIDTALSPDGERVVVADFFEDVARVYDVVTGEEILVLPGHHSSVTAVSWSPDGRWIATGSGDSFVRVWNAETGELEARLSGHTGEVITVDWGPDSRRLVSGGSDGTARVWEVEEVEAREVFRLAKQPTQLGTLAVFSPDGEQVLTGDIGIGSVQIWDLSLQGDAEVMNLPTDHLAPVDVDTLPDGRIVASARDGSVSVWRTDGTHEATIGPGGGSSEPVWRIAASPEGGRIATVRNSSGVLSVWDVGTGDRVFEVDAYPSGKVSSIDWSPDGRYLAAGSLFDGRVTIFGADGERITVLEEPTPPYYVEVLPGRSHARGCHDEHARSGAQPRLDLGLGSGGDRADDRGGRDGARVRPYRVDPRRRAVRRQRRDPRPRHRRARPPVPGSFRRGRRPRLQPRRRVDRDGGEGWHRSALRRSDRCATVRPAGTRVHRLRARIQPRRQTADHDGSRRGRPGVDLGSR